MRVKPSEDIFIVHFWSFNPDLTLTAGLLVTERNCWSTLVLTRLNSCISVCAKYSICSENSELGWDWAAREAPFPIWSHQPRLTTPELFSQHVPNHFPLSVTRSDGVGEISSAGSLREMIEQIARGSLSSCQARGFRYPCVQASDHLLCPLFRCDWWDAELFPHFVSRP